MRRHGPFFLILVALFLYSCGGGGGGGGGSSPADSPDAIILPPDLYPDFIVKSVCNDDSSRDPYYCPNNRRPINPGELIPYHNVDIPREQLSNAVPSSTNPGYNGNGSGDHIILRVNVSLDFPPYPKWNTPAEGDRDGYDKMVITDNISIEASRDPEDFGQSWEVFRDGSCTQIDTWILFPRRPNGNSFFGELVTYLQKITWEKNGEAYPGLCGPLNNPAFTRWRAQWFTYTTGKRILSIISEHYNSDSPDRATRMERFYCNNVYGCRNRWESWARREGDSLVPDWKCNGPKKENGLVMDDCRDFTNVLTGAAVDPKEWEAHIPTP